jgi:hypothetical protein
VRLRILSVLRGAIACDHFLTGASMSTVPADV